MIVFLILSCDSGVKFTNPLDEHNRTSDSTDADTVSDEDSDESLAEDVDTVSDEEADESAAEDEDTVSDEDADESVTEDADTVSDEDADDSAAEDADTVSDEDEVEPTDTENDSDVQQDPCNPNPCSEVNQSTGECIAVNQNSYECKCIEGASWRDSKCLKPCDDNPCEEDANSTGICTESGEKYTCGCNSNYKWNDPLSICKSTLPECSATSETPCFDSKTALIWSGKSSNIMTWQDAFNHCEYLNYGGYSDWRLPSITVLRTLIQNCDSSNGCESTSDGKYSKLGESVLLWSSNGGTSQASGIDFSQASSFLQSVNDSSYVRCVRRDGAETRLAKCSGLPENAEWNTVSRISQSWDWNDMWTPAATGLFNETGSTAECRFKCDSNSTRISNGQCHVKLGGPGDPSYNSPYGELSIQYSVSQVRNDSDEDSSSVGFVSSAFARGTYGNSSLPVVPTDIYSVYSRAYYDQTSDYLEILQTPIYYNNGSGAGTNPCVMLKIPGTNAVVAQLNLSLYSDIANAYIYVVDVNWDTNSIDCFHAFGEGTLNITKAEDITDHGAFAMKGNVTLYNPKNYDGNVDISGLSDIVACDPK